jgi:hypothetical protein
MGQVMKTQWQIYQELELIPDAVPQPKANLWAHLMKPLRRSLSNSFVRELADRHRIFLFNRCLNVKHFQGTDAQQTETAPPKVRQRSKALGRSRQSTSQGSPQSLELQVEQPDSSRSAPFWWDWYDAR